MIRKTIADRKSDNSWPSAVRMGRSGLTTAVRGRGCAQAGRPADAHQRLVRIGHGKLVHAFNQILQYCYRLCYFSCARGVRRARRWRRDGGIEVADALAIAGKSPSEPPASITTKRPAADRRWG